MLTVTQRANISTALQVQTLKIFAFIKLMIAKISKKFAHCIFGQKKEHCSTLRALTLIKRGKYMIILLNHTVAENLSNDFTNSSSQIGVSPFPTGTESSSPICKLEFTKSSFPHRYRAILFVLSIRQILTKDNLWESTLSNLCSRLHKIKFSYQVLLLNRFNI